jgi:cytochrome P450
MVADVERLPYTHSVVKETLRRPGSRSCIGARFATMVLTLKPRGAVRMTVEAAARVASPA